MSGAAESRLYTPEILALAVALADYPLDSDAVHAGEARSPTCGSTLELNLALDADARIDRLGMRVSACAIGQAAAALFARGAQGQTHESIASARSQIKAWLSGDNARPDWPGLAILEPARAYPGRHGAILLPWTAALAALSNSQQPS
ncbi:MAG: hypothetical protein SF172_11875 [Burkholderiales bacterium]|nr:hypothetical protein [Burkholderiales bacterium]